MDSQIAQQMYVEERQAASPAPTAPPPPPAQNQWMERSGMERQREIDALNEFQRLQQERHEEERRRHAQEQEHLRQSREERDRELAALQEFQSSLEDEERDFMRQIREAQELSAALAASREEHEQMRNHIRDYEARNPHYMRQDSHAYSATPPENPLMEEPVGGGGLPPRTNTVVLELPASGDMPPRTFTASSAGGRECTICFEKLRPSRSTFLPCAHGYHTECIRAWLSRSDDGGECPICNLAIPPNFRGRI